MHEQNLQAFPLPDHRCTSHFLKAQYTTFRLTEKVRELSPSAASSTCLHFSATCICMKWRQLPKTSPKKWNFAAKYPEKRHAPLLAGNPLPPPAPRHVLSIIPLFVSVLASPILGYHIPREKSPWAYMCIYTWHIHIYIYICRGPSKKTSIHTLVYVYIYTYTYSILQTKDKHFSMTLDF